ncbi:N-acetyltransferase [Bacteroides sp. 214]|uniref:GNAT family N-acetyltransferase n=1 Tax=Bacteroides sp. 214 TaxID=2302935 RepID=UPI0013CFA439|nr:GNAT family N-acetyltransferase [Bacteroides sp. 214]NDW11332.1 N-acetyltransferase [Bacteroides sp. 214]
MNQQYELINNEDAKQYEFHIDRHIAKIEYIINSKGDIYLTHTEVPTALGGKGIGKELVEAALKNIEKRKLEVIPLCPFVAGYIKKNPDWKRIVSRNVTIK